MNRIVPVQVPFAGIMRDGTDLRSMTQGRGTYEIEFLRYDRGGAQSPDCQMVEENQVQEEAE